MMLKAKSRSGIVVQSNKQLCVCLVIICSLPSISFPVHILDLHTESLHYSSTAIPFLCPPSLSSPHFIPHSSRLPDGVLFCHCDPLMPSIEQGISWRDLARDDLGALNTARDLHQIQRSRLSADHWSPKTRSKYPPVRIVTWNIMNKLLFISIILK